MWIRSAVDLRGMCKGYLVAFDKHFNLVCTHFFCIISHVPRKQFNFKKLVLSWLMTMAWKVHGLNPTLFVCAHIITSVIFLQAMIDVDELYRCPIAKEAQLRKDNKVLACTYWNLQPVPKYIVTIFWGKGFSGIGSCNTVYKTWFMIILLRNLSHK